jgi:regulator of protease activity HflC (stomatin/prohibitin superfamily)
MFNLKKMTHYYTRIAIAALIVGAVLFAVSLIAVSIATINYNQPIIPTCPSSVDGNSLATATDPDGIVVSVDIAHDRVGETLDITAQTLVTDTVAETESQMGISLSEIIPAMTEGGQLSARLNIFDTASEGFHNIELIFANNDVPVAQTATCRLTVQVTKVQNLNGIATIVSIQSVENPKVPTDIDSIVRQLTVNVFGGMAPAMIGVLTAFLLCAAFVSALYGLGSVGEGWQFLSYRLFGRPGFSPYLIIQGGKILMGKDSVKKVGGPAGLVIRQDSAVITEKEGKLLRIIRGPGFPRLEPFEKIWDIIDLRPQRWPFKVSAVTQDGIPITYEVAVKFRVGDTDDDILKAATCKWIREAWRTEPDRIMDWVKRVMLSATEGTMRTKILAQYKLDELLDPNIRRQIRQDLLDALTASVAEDFGVIIMEVTLHDVEFQGQVLQEWVKTWKARRDIEVEKIESDERVQEMKMRERAQSQVRQEMLDSMVEILKKMTEDSQEAPTDDYVLLSFIDMVEHTAAAQKVFIPDDIMMRLDNVKKNLHS